MTNTLWIVAMCLLTIHTQAPAPAAPPAAPSDTHAPCRVFVTETAVNPSWYVVVRDVKYGKKWYGPTSVALEALAQQAWKLKADAVVGASTSVHPSMFSWASPHAKGIAVNWTDAGRANFSTLQGRCYDQEPTKD